MVERIFRFFVFTVGVNEQTIRNYVRWQGVEDFGQAELNCSLVPRV